MIIPKNRITLFTGSACRDFLQISGKATWILVHQQNSILNVKAVMWNKERNNKGAWLFTGKVALILLILEVSCA